MRRQPSKRMRPHRVTIEHNPGIAQDEDAAVLFEGWTPVVEDAEAHVIPGRGNRLMAALKQEERLPVAVLLFADHGIRISHRIRWVDLAGRTHLYVVKSVAEEHGFGRIWTATCEEQRGG